MIKLEIIKIEKYVYTLKTADEKEYRLNLEFLDMEKELREGDYININEELLNPKYDGYSTSYTFGSLENKYGEPNILLDDIDVIKIESDELEIYLKRLYG